MIVDFHHHFGVSLCEYLGVLDRNDIVKSVLMPYDFGLLSERDAYLASFNFEKTNEFINGFLKRLDVINEKLLDSVKGFSRIVFAPWLSPECDNLESFTRARVVKFVPVFDNFTPDYFARIKPLVSEAVSNGSIVMVHTGWGAPVKPIMDLASEFPDGKFVIAHMKEDSDLYAKDRLEALSLSNVYCELSYLPHPKRVSQYVIAGLGKRLLFGSDFRRLDDEQTIRGYKAMLMESDISVDEKYDILFNNALGLLA